MTSGPVRGLEKKCTQWRKQTDKQKDGHGDSMTEAAQWGRFSGNKNYTWHKTQDMRHMTHNRWG